VTARFCGTVRRVAPQWRLFAYLSAVIEGELDESYHIWFFLAAVAGSILVGVGILLEDSWPISRMKIRERWGITLIIIGVVIEASFTFALLTFDEGVSRKQQAKIISLETHESARVLDKKQYEAILFVRGKIKAVNIMPEGALEPNGFASWIAGALQKAGIDVHILSSDGMQMTGILILYPTSLEQVGKLMDEPLYKAFTDADLTPSTGSLKNFFPFMNIPRGVPIVFVREKFIPVMKFPYTGEDPTPK
jgi:hypothetical protein